MAIFPKIQRPCPHPGDLDDIISNGLCRLCDRQVVDMTTMADNDKRRLIADNRGELCFRYTIMRPALAAMAMGLAGTAAVAADRTPSAHHRERKASSATPRHPLPPAVQVRLAGAPVIVPLDDDAAATRSSDAKQGADRVEWIQETPAPARR